MSRPATTVNAGVEPLDATNRRRVSIVALVLAVTAVAAMIAGVFWPESSTGDETYAYGDIEPVRHLWWGLLVGLGAALTLNVPAQAIVTLVLVKRRGSSWATWGAALMWIGASLQAVGIGVMAGAYFFPTDAALDRTTGTAVLESIGHDQAHLFGAMIPGALLILVGTVIQAVALLRSRAVPVWVPIATLFIVITFIVPGNGVMGLLTSLPMTTGALGLAYYAWRDVAPD